MLNISLWGKTFKNPVVAASGTFGFSREYNEIYDVSILGGIVTKGLTLNKREGNEGIRCFETSSGMLNSVGLQNPGIDYFIENELPFMKTLNTIIIANLGGGSIEEYVQGAEKLDKSDVDIIELNISCPNVKEGGVNFGIKSNIAREVVKEVRRVVKKPLVVKLSPDAEDIVDMAVTCVEEGADGVSLVNTFKAMAIDIYKKRPVFKNVFAGLSGPAIKPIALRMVYEVSKAVNVPIMGIGGIKDYKDAIEFIMAGASLVQVGTANFINPFACRDIINGIENFLKEEGINSINEIIGVI
ncbi:dihydroorotate dehydrogenase (NAD+) catalytic subunit [Caloramator fervidus]|uniref:Dihydroorotate dehydrogenase n=1 Tax=Caloramator fervidus TaxID=29344 RepID=A0A1H5RUZ6_9CLOT|nr:dihydroorotate dehydrogenase [Caloramator fervidus]SEF41437.1 dihydroorotate dehydrogenase (NAD+) catalytic subunit [Caloramator fervidus]